MVDKRSRPKKPEQRSLFEALQKRTQPVSDLGAAKLTDDRKDVEPAPAAGAAKRPDDAGEIGPAVVSKEQLELSVRIPRQVRIGTSSWSFPGWERIVYDQMASEKVLARHGLKAYAKHPLLTTVGIDRTYYAPISAAQFAEYAAAVGADFRFLVKAHEFCTTSRFPDQPRYGKRRGQENPYFLDARYAAETVVAPCVEGLKEKLGPLVFQFMPQDLKAVGGASKLVERLHTFLKALPAEVLYSVEIRNREVLCEPYREALADARASHCFTVHPRMPSVAAQGRLIYPDAEALRGCRGLVVRWMLGGNLEYETAREMYEPFDQLVAEDKKSREDIADLCARACEVAVPAFVVINNKAEGSAPLSVFRLAAEVAARLKNVQGPAAR